MIGLSKITQATNSAIIIKEAVGSNLREATARVIRSGTLDGGAVIDNMGYSDGDRTLEIIAYFSEQEEDLLWSIFKNELFINIATKEGFFYGSISRLRSDNGKVQLTILIME